MNQGILEKWLILELDRKSDHLDWLHRVTSFQRAQYKQRRNKRVTSQWKTPAKHYLRQVTKVNVIINPVNSRDPWHDAVKLALHLCDLPPQNLWPQSEHEENIIFQYRNTLKKISPTLPKTAKVIKNKESMRNYHSKGSLRRPDS